MLMFGPVRRFQTRSPTSPFARSRLGVAACVRGLGAALTLTLAGACASEPLDTPGAVGTGGGSGNGGSSCSAALIQALALVDRASAAEVAVLSRNGNELELYVDATVGGSSRASTEPWVYLSLARGERVDVTDFEALKSKAWDLALKRAVVRSNSGDGGPGLGGAVGTERAWDGLDAAAAEMLGIETERWFDAECNLLTDAAGSVTTTFTGWNVYDEVNHLLWPTPGLIYAVRGGDGKHYKLEILDYYSNPDGSTGAGDGGNYKLRVAPLD